MKKVLSILVFMLCILSFVSGVSYQTLGNTALISHPTYGKLQSLVDAGESLIDNARGVFGEELGKIEFRQYLNHNQYNFREASRATTPNSRQGGGLFDQYGYILDDDGLPIKLWINEIKSTTSEIAYQNPISRLIKQNTTAMQMSNSEVSRLLRRANEPYNWASEIIRNGGTFEFSRPNATGRKFADIGDGIRLYPDAAAGKVYVQSNRHVTFQELSERLNRYTAVHERGIINPNTGTERYLTILNENSSEISSYRLGHGTSDKISIADVAFTKPISDFSYQAAKNSPAVRTAWQDMNPEFYSKYYASIDPKRMHGRNLKKLGQLPSLESLESYFGVRSNRQTINSTRISTDVAESAASTNNTRLDSEISLKKNAVATGRYHAYEITGSLKIHGAAALLQGGLNFIFQAISHPENINFTSIGISAGAGALTSVASTLGEYASRGIYRTFSTQLDNVATHMASSITRALGKEVSTNIISRIGRQFLPSTFASLAIVGIDFASISYGESRGTISPALADSLRARSLGIEATSLAISTGLSIALIKVPHPALITLIDMGVGTLLEFIVPMPDEFNPEIIKKDISNNPSLLGEWAVNQFGF